MNNLIFWIIVCSWLIPMGIRMYNRSRQRRIRDFPPQNYPGQNFPPQNYPPQNYPYGYPPQPPVIIPAEPQPPVATPAPEAAPPSSTVPQPDTAPHGYRARKLAELDQQYSDGKIAMEDYMLLRQEIMNG
ncbi:hypothetical protein OOZ51_06905 [Arthrobacter sp. MI7-26]|uniref:hypothetical protein n=1 Tax=Arthrobacter sp. MI7-26 TaxID=2993653 RepID=UPI0022496379|nr:hypothetical protein [Arthrobacter sp. MI7-26]MCX2747545.1 hypothetical protein [Arthrobacter sp. MI7-26]